MPRLDLLLANPPQLRTEFRILVPLRYRSPEFLYLIWVQHQHLVLRLESFWVELHFETTVHL